MFLFQDMNGHLQVFNTESSRSPVGLNPSAEELNHTAIRLMSARSSFASPQQPMASKRVAAA